MDSFINIRNVKEKNSVCLVTPICHEHDFLPNLIEHNVKCGISQFIFLIHDYGLEAPQAEYFIPDEFKDIVTLIKIDKDFLDNNPRSLFKNSDVKNKILKSGNIMFHIYMYTAFDYNIIKTDWMLAIGADQYLSLEKHDSLPELLNTLDNDCDQVFIPWSCMFYNINFQLSPTLPDILRNGDNESITQIVNGGHLHMNGLVRKNALGYIDACSHYFHTKNNSKSKIYCNGDYYPYTTGNFRDTVWNKVCKKLVKEEAYFDVSKIIIHTVHFVCRGFLELITQNITWHIHTNNVIWRKYNKPDPLLYYCRVFLKYLQNKGNGNIDEAREGLQGGREIPSRMNRSHMHLQKNSSNFDRFKNMKIAKWNYKYPITNDYNNNYIYTGFKKFGFSKKTLLEIFDINLKIRNARPILSDIILLKDSIWATDSDDESDVKK